jgi:hypothetical protein
MEPRLDSGAERLVTTWFVTFCFSTALKVMYSSLQRDEDFDGSYETLLSLGGMIGDAKPKATPDHVLAGLETASYKDWATSESDQRCPICLDDVSCLFFFTGVV